MKLHRTKQKQNKKSNASRKERTRRNGWSCIWQQIFDDVDAIQWFFLTFSLFYFICYISADMCVLPFRCKFTKSTNRLHPSSDSFFLFFFACTITKHLLFNQTCAHFMCACVIFFYRKILLLTQFDTIFHATVVLNSNQQLQRAIQGI